MSSQTCISDAEHLLSVFNLVSLEESYIQYSLVGLDSVEKEEVFSIWK